MRFAWIFFILSIIILSSYKPNNKYPEQLEIKGYKIGDKVDTTLFEKYRELYLPNYLNGWSYENRNQLPEKYKGLPIAIWKLKSDSLIALTLLNDIVLNISISLMTEVEKNEMAKMATTKFEMPGTLKSYEQNHPLQEWITYWHLQTWETKDIIFQIGTAYMKKPEDAVPANIRWNLIYSDLTIENNIINNYKKKSR